MATQLIFLANGIFHRKVKTKWDQPVSDGHSVEDSNASTVFLAAKPISITRILSMTITKLTHLAHQSRVITSPKTWLTKQNCLSMTCAQHTLKNLSSCGLHLVHVTHRIKHRKVLSINIAESLITAGMHGAKKFLHVRKNLVYCRATQF